MVSWVTRIDRGLLKENEEDRLRRGGGRVMLVVSAAS